MGSSPDPCQRRSERRDRRLRPITQLSLDRRSITAAQPLRCSRSRVRRAVDLRSQRIGGRLGRAGGRAGGRAIGGASPAAGGEHSDGQDGEVG